LNRGGKVFLIANKQGDDTYLSPAIVIGTDGTTPPM
jgi:hypothetical protein